MAKKTIMKNVLLSFGLVVFIACAEGLYAADSDFRITDLRWTGTDQVEVEWTSVRGCWYRLERATGLAPGEFRIAVPNLEANPPVNATFDLLQDLSLFKANHMLVYHGETRLKLKVGRTVTLQAYVQTGEGVLPIHYLCDEERRPQLVTTSLLSWALRGVA